MDELYDIVIIGSGAGGSPIAHQLVLAGKRVLMLEKGPLIMPQYQVEGRVSGFKRDELISDGAEKILRLDVDNHGASYYSSHVEPDLNDEPHVYRRSDDQGKPIDAATIEGYTAQVVGGGTQLYGGVSLRYTPRDLTLAQWNNREGAALLDDPNEEVRRAARDWPITYETLEPYYARAEELVGINGETVNQLKPFTSGNHYQPPLQYNPISEHVKTGMDALAMKYYRTPLAVITQDHAPSGRQGPQNGDLARTSYVNRYGDPMGFKSSTWVSLLSPIHERDNFTLLPNCTVTHLQSEGSRVSAVHFLDPDGVEHSVSGRVVVVACSAIESVRLLKLSAEQDKTGFAPHINQDNNGMLGAYFLTHCFGGASGLVSKPSRFDKSQSLDSDFASDYCHRDEFLAAEKLWAGAVIYNNTSDRALPLALARNVDSHDLDTLWDGFNQATNICGQAMHEFLDDSFGRGLSLTFMANQVPQKINRIELHPTVRDKWGRAVAYIIKDWHPHDHALMERLSKQCYDVLSKGGIENALSAGEVYGKDELARCANHILGGARFGLDSTDSVLDPDCRAWGFDNLYVTDGSFMPTSGGANPTLTIEANAFRVADILLGRL
ncbi:GMC oxidoreductase [Paraburkholderia sp. DHOC27]|uniref:GMC oxidoreductase n=1 Tax=Paraburkholderia sp. DHOC27 TaxID=2303330 RepID=UPI000E3E5C23|nr:GMC family oxidoreductase [Paraburkholderia sp. DHOC27]RFU49370.1 GMC family oxidoreductase [Paraburkholderia sp. DHOC27]